MARRPLRVPVSARDRKELHQLLSGEIQPVRVVLRALALLHLAEGTSSPEVARSLKKPQVGRETIRILLQSHDLKPWREKNVVVRRDEPAWDRG